MDRALALAARGRETTTPNPRVGCVLVRDGQLLAEGWHERAGGPHAEIHALRALAAQGGTAQGATAYVTLEPCSHTGRTGPCCVALAEAGIAQAVVAMEDPNPLVAGRGLRHLAAAGIALRTGLGREGAEALNPGFLSRMRRQRPWVRLKVGMSLDGRTALANGASQWITSDAARADVQRLRAEACAVLTGSGTQQADDPRLTVRDRACSRQPLRILLDSTLQVPATARLLTGGGALVLTRQTLLDRDAETGRRADLLRSAGTVVQGVQECEDGTGQARLDLANVMAMLAAWPLNEVLVEAGARLNGALLQAGLVDECLFYVAPSLLGDAARGPARLGPLTTLAERYALQFIECVPVGPDLRITARPV